MPILHSNWQTSDHPIYEYYFTRQEKNGTYFKVNNTHLITLIKFSRRSGKSRLYMFYSILNINLDTIDRKRSI
jgi:hypothetical protein